MKNMTSYERISRTFEGKETDRIPMIDSPWAGTIRRWKAEGMPADADWRDFFGVDKVASIGVDITPQYETKILEETDRYKIVTSAWGVTMKKFKMEDSTPEFLDFKVCDAEKWLEAKQRMTPSRDRVNWKKLENDYPLWKKEGQWITAQFWFGFDVAHSWMAGTETILCALAEEPEWVKDIFNTYLEMCIAQFDMIWDAGYRFDGIKWPDDMGYKGRSFFSPETYRALLKPFHKRAVDWAHAHGLKAELHSCGNIMELLPDIIETGIDVLNPLEVKAGMDAAKVKKTYGKKLVLHGGINAALFGDRDAVMAEVNEKLPILAEGGRYFFASDHSIPNSTSLETFRCITDAVKNYGKKN